MTLRIHNILNNTTRLYGVNVKLQTAGGNKSDLNGLPNTNTDHFITRDERFRVA